MLRQRLCSLHACNNSPLASLLSQLDVPILQGALSTSFTTSAAPLEQHGAATASRARATPPQQQRQAQQAQQALLQKYTGSGQRGGGMIRSMGAGSPPMTDLARENAPTKVLELIGDPRSGVADDVARNPFGSLTVDMVHYQPSNEVYWYKYELDGNSLKETHRDARLSEYSKNLLYLLRAKDPNRWTVEALSKKFRIRKQRVMAILALKEMEGHSLERSIEQGGPMSAYACRVHMSDLNLDPASGEPMELGSDELRRLEIDAANAAVSPPPPTSVLQGSLDLDAAVAEADPAVLPLHNALPRAAVMTHQVQLELLASLRSLGFDLQRLRADVQAGLDQAESRLRASLPASIFEQQQQQQEDSDSPEQGEAGKQPSAEQQQHAAVSAAVSALLEQKRHTLALLDALEDVLLEPHAQGTAERRPFRSAPLEQERRIAAVVSALPRALSSSTASKPGGSSGGGGGGGGGSGSTLDGLLAGLEGQQLLRVVHSLQPATRAVLLNAHLPTKVTLNTMGVDLTALTNLSTSPSGARAAPGSSQSAKPQARAQLFPDALGYTYISPAQYARMQHALTSLGSASAASAGAVQAASSAAASPSSPQGGQALGVHSSSSRSSIDPLAQQQQQQRQALLPAHILASAARLARSYRAVSGAQDQMWSAEQKAEVNRATSPEDVARRLRVMAEVDPQLVEAAYDVEAVMQVRKLGTRSTEDKEAQLWWDALQRYKATHEGAGSTASSSGEGEEAEGGSAKRRSASDISQEGGSGPARRSWDAIAAWLDVFPGGKVYHRGSGERQITRMPSFPAFEGLPLSAVDTLQESELSAVNRVKAAEQEEQLWSDFRTDLIYNLGLRGEGLRDNSTPPQPTNLTSSVDEAPMVVYDITREGNTVHPPLFVLDQGGKRPLNEQEQVFQEQRLREVHATQYPWLRPHYTVRRTKYKTELQ